MKAAAVNHAAQVVAAAAADNHAFKHTNIAHAHTFYE